MTRAPRLVGERSQARHAGNVHTAGLWPRGTASPHATARGEEGRLRPERGAEGLSHGPRGAPALLAAGEVFALLVPGMVLLRWLLVGPEPACQGNIS